MPPQVDRARRPLVALCLALLLIAVVAFASPAPPVPRRRDPDILALQAARARGDDLASQNRRKDDLLRRPRPQQVDDSDEARADDLAAQLHDLEDQLRHRSATPADTARADDLKRQLDAVHARLGEPHPTGDSGRARADDLKRQVDELSAQLARPRTTTTLPVTAALSKSDVVAAHGLFGLYTLQAPFDLSEVGLVQTLVERKANLVGYFQDWSHPFRPDAIEATWRHGQIPLITWEPETPQGRADPPFTLASIIDGQHDDLIHGYAQGIRQLGLPVVIRLAHEMNGYWYPWSETRAFDGSSVNGNQRGEYVRMWRHIHDIFAEDGANDYTIWLWAPNRVDQIPRQPHVSEFYPGDEYVDWVGMSGYLRGYPDEAPTFDNVYAATLTQLAETTRTKPVFLAEIGATETGGQKTVWEHDFFNGLVRHPEIVGFAWFNLTVSGMRWGDMQTSDWRINSTTGSSDAVRDGLAVTGYGLPPTG